MDDIAKKLVGKEIVGYKISEDRESIIFEIAAAERYNGPKGKSYCQAEPVVLTVYGDCCSQSWIESLDTPANLIGTVQSVEDLDMPNLGNVGTKHHPDVDQIRYYGLKIVTDKGHCVIDYRNDSNGYYGGWIA